MGKSTMAKNNKGKAKPAKVKHRLTRAIPVGAQIPCVDNSGAKLLNVISVYFGGSRLNRLPSASIGDMMLVSDRESQSSRRRSCPPCSSDRERCGEDSPELAFSARTTAPASSPPRDSLRDPPSPAPSPRSAPSCGPTSPPEPPPCSNYAEK